MALGEIFGIGNIKDLQKLRKKHTSYITPKRYLRWELPPLFLTQQPFFCLKCLYSDDRAAGLW